MNIQTTVSGIPCFVEIEMIEPATSTQCAQFDIEVFDRKGYKANWLQAKLNKQDVDRIEKLYYIETAKQNNEW